VLGVQAPGEKREEREEGEGMEQREKGR